MIANMVATVAEPVLAAIGLAIFGMLANVIRVHTATAIAAFERRTGVHVEEADIDRVRNAMKTASGQLIVQIASGKIKLGDLATNHPVVADMAKAAIARVPDAAAAINFTPRAAAEILIGMVGNAIKEDPTASIIPAAPAATLEFKS